MKKIIATCVFCICMCVSYAYGKCAACAVDSNGLCSGNCKICGNGGCYACCDSTNGGENPTPIDPTPTCSAGNYASADTCVPCPEWTGVYTTSALTTIVRGTSAAGATAITGCYGVAGTYYDTTGTFSTTGQCKYQK
ncbi:MAG: hypothetical protein NC311_01515 [Muribaculaceae bacterium]|nr:hypothetical protein [Muribaculaceae bacterium]